MPAVVVSATTVLPFSSWKRWVILPAPWNLNLDAVIRSAGLNVLSVEPFAGASGVGGVTFKVVPSARASPPPAVPPALGDTGFELLSPEPQAMAVASATATPNKYNFLDMSDSVWMRGV